MGFRSDSKENEKTPSIVGIITNNIANTIKNNIKEREINIIDDVGIPFSTDFIAGELLNLGRSFESKGERGRSGYGLRESQQKKLKKKPTENDKLILRCVYVYSVFFFFFFVEIKPLFVIFRI
jgi:hypothetical protein